MTETVHKRIGDYRSEDKTTWCGLRYSPEVFAMPHWQRISCPKCLSRRRKGAAKEVKK